MLKTLLFSIVLCSGSAAADGPTLSPLAVTFRDQLRTAHTMRLFLVTDVEHFPSEFLVHFRDDGAIVLDGPANFLRYTWDGNTLWYDQNGGPPPEATLPEVAQVIPTIWQAARSSTTVWLPRGPSDYGLSRQSGEYAEIVLPGPRFEGWHVFVSFGREGPPGPRRIDIHPPVGEPVRLGIIQVDVNPPLPPQVFSKNAPPVAIPFPKVCGGVACPGPPFPDPPPALPPTASPTGQSSRSETP